MYKKIILISSFICLCAGFQCVAQSIKTNLNVTVHECDYLNNLDCASLMIAEITQEFVLEKFPTDTLFLELKNPHWGQSFTYPHRFPKIAVEIISKNKKQSIEPDFNGFTLSIPLPTPSCTVKVNYLYSSDSGFSFPSGLYLWTCYYSKNSWYFSCANMQIEKAEFNNPEDSLIYLFVNAPSFRQNEKITVDMKSMGDKSINFFLAYKPFFQETTIIQHTDTIHIYLDKGDITTPNPEGSISNNTVVPGHRVTQALKDSCVESLTQALNKIKAVFPSDGAAIDIVDADLSVDNFAFGTASSDVNNNHHMVLIHHSMWSNQSLIHELIHLYNTVPLVENDSTYYFFGESLTEYLAVYIHYEDKYERNLIFNQKIMNFSREPNSDYSIFKLSSNSRDMNTGRGSSAVVYDKTPFVIHTFAQTIGEEKFHAALKQFYTKVAEGTAINLPVFEQTLKENGVTDEQWNWFIRNL